MTVPNGSTPAAAAAAAAAGCEDAEKSVMTTTSTASSSSETLSSAIPLRPVVMDYAWGIRGMDSRVGRYALESGTIEEIDPDTPYAELWIGTHPKGPSVLAVADDENQLLEDALGGKQLPFLFKVSRGVTAVTCYDCDGARAILSGQIEYVEIVKQDCRVKFEGVK
jgi:hypothetical protein